MKFSFEFSRSAPKANTGAAIKSAKVMPEDSPAIRAAQKAWSRGSATRGTRMYDAAMTTLQSADFLINQTSANAEISVSAIQATSRARALARDNPYAKQICRIKRNNVVGHKEFRLEMAVRPAGGKKTKLAARGVDKDAAEIVEQAWEEAGLPQNCTNKGNLSRLELYLQAKTALTVSGGAIFRHLRGFRRNKFGYAVQALEVDRLEPTFQGFDETTRNPIRMSVEYDKDDGWIEAYYILTRHPGDVAFPGSWEGLNANKFRERIPAADLIVAWNFRERQEQERGMSELDSVIQRLHRIDQWDVAYVTAAIWRACNSAFLSRDLPQGTEYQADEEGAEGEQIDVSEPGTLRMLPPGFKVIANDNKFPLEAAEAFQVSNLRAVSAGAGVAYHAATGDLERVNFSSGRLGENNQRDEFMTEQELMIDNIVFPHFAEWLKYALLSKAIALPVSRYDELLAAASFNGRRWPYVNPLQDAQADILRMEAGLVSPDALIKGSEEGGDVESVAASIAHSREVYAENKLDFTGTDPTKPTIPKGEPGAEVPNPENPENMPAKTGGKQTIKARLIDYDRLELTLRRLHATDPEFEKSGELDQFLEFRKRRNGSLNGKH